MSRLRNASLARGRGARPPNERIAVLSIAGSDSGGGAGIQMDLRVFGALGVFGTTALTCVTAQNPAEVRAVRALSADLVRRQIETVRAAFPIAAVKTGMLFSAPIIRAVAQALARDPPPVLVVDPVMVAASGAPLLRPDAIDALCGELLPRADALTPNLHETALLWGRPIRTVAALRRAAEDLAARYGAACLAKGGTLGGNRTIDVWCGLDGAVEVMTGPRVRDADTHGAGCALSAALTAYLARGLAPRLAARRARALVRAGLRGPWRVGPYRPLAVEPEPPPAASGRRG